MSHLNTTWILLLAAGASSRFGSPKALASWKQGTLISHAITISTAVVGPRILVVLGANAECLKSHVQAIHSTFNDIWDYGMGSSIAKGIQAITELDKNVETVIIFPVDQPLVSSQHLAKLAENCFQTGHIILTANSSEKGPPACLPRHYFPQALVLNSTRGLKSFLTEANHSTIYNSQALMDADTPNMLEKLMNFC